MPWNELEAREHVRLWRGLLNLRTPKQVQPRSLLFVQGTRTDRVFLIEQGLIKLEIQARDGRKAALPLIFPGDWVGICCACLGGRHFLSGITLTHSLVHEIELRRLNEVCGSSPDAAKLLRAAMAANFKGVLTALVALKLQSGRDRFERLLADFASVVGRRIARNRPGLRLPLRDADIADLISVTPAHLSRIKRKLNAEGRFETKGGLVYLASPRSAYRLHEFLDL